MQRKRFYYIIKIQYLGFRYHGWQKQPGLKTVERMIERTIAYVLQHKNFKLLAAGRTDAKVSANQTLVELFVDKTPLDLNDFFQLLNQNLPQDIRALDIFETTETFNIIKHPKIKEYLYFFAFGEKFHPFCAPLMTNFLEDLDIELMQEAAKLFEGKHDFWSYAFRPKPQTQTEGKILRCEIVENDIYSANFFPDKSYVLRVEGEGFKRYQIRLMMGVLIELGRGDVDLYFIKSTLNPANKLKLTYVAPASGLILNSSELIEKEGIE